MSLTKTLIAGAFTLGLATAGYAQDGPACLDGSVATGDCIVIIPDQASGESSDNAASQTAETGE